MKLNCDLGEGAGFEAAVMPYIDQANIACGYHAGSPELMRKTLLLAKEHDKLIGAHPGYDDREGFGRRPMPYKSDQIFQLVWDQIGILESIAESEGVSVDYVKPHGALYHDMIKNKEVRTAVFSAVAEFPSSLAIMIQSTPKLKLHHKEAAAKGLCLWAEAFADRRYDSSGHLLPRKEPEAMLRQPEILAQVQQLVAQKSVTTNLGDILEISADTICVHGDHAEAVKGIEEIRNLLGDG